MRRIGLLAILALAACTPAAPPTPTTGAAVPTAAPQRDSDQVLKITVNRLSDNLTPRGYASNPWLYWPLYDSVTAFGPDFEVRPMLAEKWELAADGLNWTFTIREGVTFSNGTPVTAEDVAFTFDTIAKVTGWPQKGLLATMTGAKATGPRTVVVTTSQQDMSVPAGSVYVYVLSQKYWDAVGGFDGYLAKPIGSGPYDITEYIPSQKLVYTPRSTPHAFRKVENKGLVFTALADNGQAINGLRTGESDITLLRSFTGSQADGLKKEGVTVIAYLNTNASMKIPQGSVEQRGSALKDIRVRQALNYAVNREGIAKNLFNGYATAVGQNGIPGSSYWDPSIPAWPYDPAKAKSLLAEAGYPNGLKLTGGLDFASGVTAPDVPLAVQGDLKAVGVEIDLNPVELATFSDKSFGRNNQIKGDLYFSGSADTNGFFTLFRGSNGCGRPIGSMPVAQDYCNPTWDRIFDQTLAERDPAKRADLFKQAAKIQRDDLWTLYITNGSSFHAHTAKILGIPNNLMNAVNLDSAYRVR